MSREDFVAAIGHLRYIRQQEANNNPLLGMMKRR
jgi:predicted alpha/beta hydrolase